MSHEFSSIPEAVDSIARGEVVIVVDAENRENEGDFIAAADRGTPEPINFILSGRCDFGMSILPDLAKRLDIYPLVESNPPNL